MDKIFIRMPDWNIWHFLFNLRHYLLDQKKNNLKMAEPGFEHSELKGITIKNMIVTVICTATLVITIMGSYAGLKAEISDVRHDQSEHDKITDLRIRVVEDQQKILSEQIKELQNRK